MLKAQLNQMLCLTRDYFSSLKIDYLRCKKRCKNTWWIQSVIMESTQHYQCFFHTTQHDSHSCWVRFKACQGRCYTNIVEYAWHVRHYNNNNVPGRWKALHLFTILHCKHIQHLMEGVNSPLILPSTNTRTHIHTHQHTHTHTGQQAHTKHAQANRRTHSSS